LWAEQKKSTFGLISHQQQVMRDGRRGKCFHPFRDFAEVIDGVLIDEIETENAASCYS
jgi:hypothetical protein